MLFCFVVVKRLLLGLLVATGWFVVYCLTVLVWCLFGCIALLFGVLVVFCFALLFLLFVVVVSCLLVCRWLCEFARFVFVCWCIDWYSVVLLL